jgi:hypothetical protein
MRTRGWLIKYILLALPHRTLARAQGVLNKISEVMDSDIIGERKAPVPIFSMTSYSQGWADSLDH